MDLVVRRPRALRRTTSYRFTTHHTKKAACIYYRKEFKLFMKATDMPPRTGQHIAKPGNAKSGNARALIIHSTFQMAIETYKVITACS